MDDSPGAATETRDHADAGLGGGMPPAAHQTPRADAAPPASQGSGLSRREVLVGAGGTSAPLDDYGVDTGDGLRQAKVFTRANRPVPGTAAGTWTRAAADAVEDATWSAMRDPSTGYGVAVFDLDPGEPGGETSITVTYHHAAGLPGMPTRRPSSDRVGAGKADAPLGSG